MTYRSRISVMNDCKIPSSIYWFKTVRHWHMVCSLQVWCEIADIYRQTHDWYTIKLIILFRCLFDCLLGNMTIKYVGPTAVMAISFTDIASRTDEISKCKKHTIQLQLWLYLDNNSPHTLHRLLHTLLTSIDLRHHARFTNESLSLSLPLYLFRQGCTFCMRWQEHVVRAIYRETWKCNDSKKKNLLQICAGKKPSYCLQCSFRLIIIHLL